MDIKYRELQLEEAHVLWDMMSAIDNETKYMMFEPGERTKNLDMIKNMIALSQKQELFLLAAECDGELAGYICAQKGRLQRILHTAYIVVGIREKFRRKGIGTRFFKLLDQWAEDNGITRLELTVVTSNTAAVKLYEKSGFVIEGTKKQSMLIDKSYVDEYYMAKLKKGEA